MNRLVRLTGRFCFVERITTDIQSGYIGKPLYFDALRLYPPAQGPFTKEYAGQKLPIADLPERRIREWIYKAFPAFKSSPDFKNVKGAERYYRSPVDLWVDRYLYLREKKVSESDIKASLISEIEAEIRQYQFENFVQMEQAASYGVPWRHEKERLRAQFAPGKEHLERCRALEREKRKAQLKYLAEEALGLPHPEEEILMKSKDEPLAMVDEFGENQEKNENEGTEEDDVEDEEEEDSYEMYGEDGMVEEANRVAENPLTLLQIPDGMDYNEIMEFFNEQPHLRGAFDFQKGPLSTAAEQFDCPFKTKMVHLGNGIDPQEWPAKLQDELLDKLLLCKTRQEATKVYEETLEKAGQAYEEDPTSFTPTPSYTAHHPLEAPENISDLLVKSLNREPAREVDFSEFADPSLESDEEDEAYGDDNDDDEMYPRSDQDGEASRIMESLDRLKVLSGNPAEDGIDFGGNSQRRGDERSQEDDSDDEKKE